MRRCRFLCYRYFFLLPTIIIGCGHYFYVTLTYYTGIGCCITKIKKIPKPSTFGTFLCEVIITGTVFLIQISKTKSW
jgi:hypothetical protein